MRLFNFHFKASSHQLKYRKNKNSPKYHNILMSTFWEIVLCVLLLFGRHVCLSNTRRHSSYRWAPAKLCSAILTGSQKYES